MNINFEELSNKLQSISPAIPSKDNSGSKPSSVIVPLYKKENSIHVILTKRTEHLKSHPGQISFPGGMYHEEDGALYETALREWEEEMGVSRDCLKLIGEYKSFITRTGYKITPFICEYLGDFSFKTSVDEVDYCIFFELEDFNKLPFYSFKANDLVIKQVYYLDHSLGLLWGATCEIMVNLIKDFFNFQREPEYVRPNLIIPPFFKPPSYKK